ncbi:MAG: HAMP domain-containing histidine kinase [Clostridiales bacterium]|jgi:signal transduction histidine kinase|nr:HAMP domain-containing histidine kinase [Clostridiales bacterium]
MKKSGEYIDTIEMLAATMAHEVKNPLSLIRANIDYIELWDKEKRLANNCRVIKGELQKAQDMLVRFIDLIRIIYKFDEEVTVYDVIMNVVENYRDKLNGVVSFNVDCSDKNLHFEGNFQLFSIALSNILKNSVEAASSGANVGEIDIAAFRDDENIKITIKDNGPGLSAEALEGIKSRSGYTSKQFGSGVGISICQNIIHEHYGDFSIENASENGCVVTITVPEAQ